MRPTRPPSSLYRRDKAPAPAPPATAPPSDEIRLYGLNAVLAVFAKRPQDIRKLWLSQSRLGPLRELIAFCVANRLGYRVVDEAELAKVADTQHHEGVVAAVKHHEPLSLSNWLRDSSAAIPDSAALAVWLDGVGNPHNFGAILRSCAHFGAAVLLPKDAPLGLSGAAARVAEGGAESVPLIRLGRSDNSIAQLRSAGFVLIASSVDRGESLYKTALPKRCVLIIGAEGQGVDPALAAASAKQVAIPGTGAVESLNVAAATAVFLAEWRRVHLS